MAPKYPPAEERFWAKVEKGDECWIWTGCTDKDGYGRIRVDGSRSGPRTPIRVHRYSWELHNGEIAEGLWVLHHCDNPSCVRPDHLYLGDAAQNNRDAMSRKRFPKQRQTHCKRGHPLSGDNLYIAKGHNYRL